MQYNGGMKNAGRTNAAVSMLIKDGMSTRGITQADIANKIGRKAQSYVSNRLNNRDSWSIAELDIIAPLLGYTNALALIASAVT